MGILGHRQGTSQVSFLDKPLPLCTKGHFRHVHDTCKIPLVLTDREVMMKVMVTSYSGKLHSNSEKALGLSNMMKILKVRNGRSQQLNPNQNKTEQYLLYGPSLF